MTVAPHDTPRPTASGPAESPRRAGLSVGEAARELGVSIDTLRYYEREDLLRTPRTASGHRRYFAADLEWLAVLTCLRETGMPIRRMREFAGLVGADDDATIGARIDLLEEHRGDVLRRIRELEGNLAHVEGKIAWYRGRMDPPPTA
jgi:DNA-binding transcriptional MerR regulator